MVYRKKTEPTFVVYIRFPSSHKEYCYLCNIPGIGQGDFVIANGARVSVLRTAAFDSRATHFVQPLPDQKEIEIAEYKKKIIARLRQLQAEHQEMEVWQKIAAKNAEAKKLLAEYKKL